MSRELQQKLDLEAELWENGFKEESARINRTDSIEGFILDMEVKKQDYEKIILIAKKYLWPEFY